MYDSFSPAERIQYDPEGRANSRDTSRLSGSRQRLPIALAIIFFPNIDLFMRVSIQMRQIHKRLELILGKGFRLSFWKELFLNLRGRFRVITFRVTRSGFVISFFAIMLTLSLSIVFLSFIETQIRELRSLVLVLMVMG